VTVLEVLAVTAAAKIRLEPRGAQLHVEAPAGTMTRELRAALEAHKPLLLAILDRVQSMRHFERVAPRAVPYAWAWVKPGPGHCVSCGVLLERPEAYGRCTPCDVAIEVLSATRHHVDERF
jgi:hypothetical protein